MGTSFETVFSAFLSTIESDDWSAATDAEMEQDLKTLLLLAIEMFARPRISLQYSGGIEEASGFDEVLGKNEIQILALFMSYCWYSRVVDSWHNIRPMYAESDFSPAKLLDSFEGRLETKRLAARRLESRYYRSINGDLSVLARLSGKKK